MRLGSFGTTERKLMYICKNGKSTEQIIRNIFKRLINPVIKIIKQSIIIVHTMHI